MTRLNYYYLFKLYNIYYYYDINSILLPLGKYAVVDMTPIK